MNKCLGCENFVNKTKQNNTSGFCRKCSARRKASVANVAAANKRRLRPYEWLYRALCREAPTVGHKVEITYDQFVTFTRITNCHYCNDVVVWNTYSTANGKHNRAVWNLD